jgi:hypothetical protein
MIIVVIAISKTLVLSENIMTSTQNQPSKQK